VVLIALGGIEAPRAQRNCHSLTRVNVGEIACVGEGRIRSQDRPLKMR
jgi:hypothetical protein